MAVDVTLSIANIDSIPLAVDVSDDLSLSIGGERHYSGPTEIVPDGYAHVLPTAGRVVSENIVIEPIPSNYGLVQWNGVYLSVS